MTIVERIKQIIQPQSMRSSAIEYGAAPEAFHGNTLFDFEVSNWKVLCIQAEKECAEETGIYRRFVINEDCSRDGGSSLDEIVKRINVDEIKILLIKNTPHPLEIIGGFSLDLRETEIVCVQQEENNRNEVSSYLRKKGFRFLERVLVSDIYIKDENNVTNDLQNIFQV